MQSVQRAMRGRSGKTLRRDTSPFKIIVVRAQTHRREHTRIGNRLRRKRSPVAPVCASPTTPDFPFVGQGRGVTRGKDGLYRAASARARQRRRIHNALVSGTDNLPPLSACRNIRETRGQDFCVERSSRGVAASLTKGRGRGYLANFTAEKIRKVRKKNSTKRQDHSRISTAFIHPCRSPPRSIPSCPHPSVVANLFTRFPSPSSPSSWQWIWTGHRFPQT